MRETKKSVLIIIYLMMVAFITIYVRIPNLASEPINTKPFQSLNSAIGGNQKQISQIILNIALFIPLGYLLTDLADHKAIIISLVISLIIECIQFFSYRGQFDVDDLIYNTIGGALGALIFFIMKRWKIKKIVPYVLLVAGVVGCLIAVQRPKEPQNYTKQFDYRIFSTACFDNEVKLVGTCEIYGRETPQYDLFLDDLKMDTVVEGNHFKTSIAVDEGKHELFVEFAGYNPISTGTYISLSSGEQVKIEYVPGEIVIPFSLHDNYILKAYNPNQSTYVFQNENKLIWYIGWDITPSTEVIYHIYTNEPEKLPENRKQYGYENRGFRVDSSNEFESENGYRVFEKIIPDTYNVTAITVGFNTDEEVTWLQYFRVEK